MPRTVPIVRPLPNVTNHVQQPEPVRREAPDRRRTIEPVTSKVLPRELALPDVREMASLGLEFVAPGKLAVVGASPRRKLPLGLSRQALAGPPRVSRRVGVRHVHNGMVHTVSDAALGPVRMPPVCSEAELPPLRPVAE